MSWLYYVISSYQLFYTSKDMYFPLHQTMAFRKFIGIFPYVDNRVKFFDEHTQKYPNPISHCRGTGIFKGKINGKSMASMPPWSPKNFRRHLRNTNQAKKWVENNETDLYEQKRIMTSISQKPYINSMIRHTNCHKYNNFHL